jgi:hypothetical protein
MGIAGGGWGHPDQAAGGRGNAGNVYAGHVIRDGVRPVATPG